MVKPITPQEVNKEYTLPDFVVQAINNVIKRNYRGTVPFTIKSDEIVNEIISLSNDKITRKRIFEERLMDFEELYSKYGWVVTYEKPSIGDNDFEPYFTFDKL